MSWHLLKSECVTLPRAKAIDFATRHAQLPKSPVEREVEPSRVKKLVAVLHSRVALPFNWATVEYQGQTVRMNGQHSSKAIMEAAADLPESFSFHLDHYTAENRKDMVELFRQFDQRWSGRSALDISGAYQGLVPELVDFNRKVMKAAADGISWCRRVVEGLDAPKGDLVSDLLHQSDHLSFFVWVNGILNARRELVRTPVMAALFKTHEVSQSGATKFWRDVSFGPDFFTDDSHPGAVLIGELIRSAEEKDFRAKEFEHEHVYYKKAIKAWNAFCAGQRINSLKVSKGKGWPEVARYGEQQEEEAA